MTIRVFNPEHDLALASNLERFTSPHAGRQLRADLSFIPALWSEDGDIVVVEDIDYAESSYKNMRKVEKANVEFCTFEQLPHILSQEEINDITIDPWGWNPSIRFQFASAGVPDSLLPHKDLIKEVRRLSSRQMTTDVISFLRQGIEEKTCGESTYISDNKSFNTAMLKQKNIVVKAPWSSSGRGVRYIFDSQPNDNAMNWINNTLRLQGGVMVEPLYNKVKDFAMEFRRDSMGKVSYLGLSLFYTRNGAYTGNILATEYEKRTMLSEYLDLNLLDEVTRRLESVLTNMLHSLDTLELSLGVDMMVVANSENGGFLLHPCVEINLRRTMGHVALSLSPSVPEQLGNMIVKYESNKYYLKKTTLTKNN